MGYNFENYRIKTLQENLKILSGEVEKITDDYLQLVKEKEEPQDEVVHKLNEKIFEKDKEIVSLKGKLDDCISPSEFKEINKWFNEHLTKVFNSNEKAVPAQHSLEWEVICTGPGLIRRVKCKCGIEKDFSPEW